MCGARPRWFYFVFVAVYFDVDRDRHRDDGRAGGAAGDVIERDFDVHFPDVYYSVDHDHYFHDGADHDHDDSHQPGRAGEPDAGWLSSGVFVDPDVRAQKYE